jgi:SAM-dependent methyltransferase
MAPKMAGPMQGQSVLHSPACERNREPILAMLQDWLPEGARVLEIGSGGGHHAAFFCGQVPGLVWQASELQGSLAMLQAQLAALTPTLLAPGAQLLPPIPLDVTQAGQWPHQSFDAVFTANTCHIMPAMALPQLLAGAARVLRPRGLVLLYGPFHDGGVPTAASNVAFDAHLRSLDPAMGVRDALDLQEQAAALGLQPLADVAMPANNRTLIFQLEDSPGRQQIAARTGDQNRSQFKPC